MPNKKKRSALATEVSAHGRIDGVLTQFPTIVPNSTEEEIAHIVSGGLSDRENPLTKLIYIKAEQFAKKMADSVDIPFVSEEFQRALAADEDRASVKITPDVSHYNIA